MENHLMKKMIIKKKINKILNNILLFQLNFKSFSIPI